MTNSHEHDSGADCYRRSRPGSSTHRDDTPGKHRRDHDRLTCGGTDHFNRANQRMVWTQDIGSRESLDAAGSGCERSRAFTEPTPSRTGVCVWSRRLPLLSSGSRSLRPKPPAADPTQGRRGRLAPALASWRGSSVKTALRIIPWAYRFREDVRPCAPGGVRSLLVCREDWSAICSRPRRRADAPTAPQPNITNSRPEAETVAR